MLVRAVELQTRTIPNFNSIDREREECGAKKYGMHEIRTPRKCMVMNIQ